MASALTFFRTIKTIKPHVPLIKFRKGGTDGTHHSSANIAAQPSASSPKISSTKAVSGPTIEDYQLPLKYRRRLIDEAEISAINSGGVI